MAPDVLTRNHVKVFGEGTQPMVFAHGFGCDQNMWRFAEATFFADNRADLPKVRVPALILQCSDDMIAPQLDRKGVAFAVELAPDLVMRADREKVQQILINLLGNAAKFTPDG